jgi:hypothetical protein
MNIEPAKASQTVDSSPSDAVRVATKLYAAFARGDMDGVLALFDPAIEFRAAEGHPYRPDGTPWIGPETVLTELFVRLGEEWERFAVHPLVITLPPQGREARRQAIHCRSCCPDISYPP